MRLEIVAMFQIRCLPALALLHPDDVPDGYEAVAAELPDAAAELAAYFERQYIGANVGGRRRPPQFAVPEWNQFYRTLGGHGRTNNGVEGWHNRFNNAVNCAHPNVYKLLRHLSQEEDHWRSEVIKIHIRGDERHRRARWQVISDRLQALAERRRNGEVAMADYLRAVAHNFTL
ncbi:hypothetical protein FJT64_007094 [Amphibalanus amphitrite]|uniref:MULE transposase domain-containing protein n=1 Tax=Amphibalanus amphitrite TaxID=1232801 RepID=A0A6A4VZM7_AMPAM|nr:hypothetical protein FJT64_007094 [Amphibalanus amphitrite]